MKKVYNQIITKDTNDQFEKITRKIGDKNDLLNFLSEYFNVDKELLDFEFQDDYGNGNLLKSINEIKYKYSNLNIKYSRDFVFDDIIIQLDDTYQLHVKHMYHGYTTNYFLIWTEPLNNQTIDPSALMIEWVHE